MSRKDLYLMISFLKRILRVRCPDASRIRGSKFIDILCFTGIAESENNSENGETIYIEAGLPENEGKLSAVFQSNFEISAPPGCPFPEELHAAICGAVSSYDISRTYHITKQSFASALSLGLKTSDLNKKLTAEGSPGLPQNLLFSLQQWEQEYGSISLKQGIIMTVDSRRLPLLLHSPQLAEYLKDSPAEGIFILDPAEESSWRPAFINAGFELLPSVIRAGVENPEKTV